MKTIKTMKTLTAIHTLSPSLLATALISVLASSTVMAADINQVYQLAIENDAELSVAKAKRGIGHAQASLARSALLPQISLGATKSKTEIDTKVSNTTTELNALSYKATVSQTLFNLNSWYNYQAAASGARCRRFRICFERAAINHSCHHSLHRLCCAPKKT